MKVKGEGGILVLRLRRKITITSRWSWRLKFWESEQLLKPERATGVPGVDSAVKSSMTYPKDYPTTYLWNAFMTSNFEVGRQIESKMTILSHI